MEPKKRRGRGPTVHKIIDKDPETMRGVCAHCGPVRLRFQAPSHYVCAIARHTKSRTTPKHRVGMGGFCERCSFVPEHTAQLDVHHINHVHADNSPANLRTLCANCHRLEHAGHSPRVA